MTQLGQLYEKEKIEYANQKVRENVIKERNEMALKMLNRNMNIIDIMEVTGLTEDELLRLQNENVIAASTFKWNDILQLILTYAVFYPWPSPWQAHQPIYPDNVSPASKVLRYLLP